MPESSSWDVILGEASTRTVLGIDFPADGRSEADLAGLAAMIGSEYRFLRARPRPARLGEALSGDAYTESWIESLRRDGRPVLAVLGHRVGCVYAAEIAQALGRWQQSPAIILLDPEPASTRLLSRTFSAEVNANQAFLSADEIARARRAAADIADRQGGIASVAAEIVNTYLDLLAVPWERIGLGDLRESKSARSFESRITWLAAASQLDPSDTWERSVVIMSADNSGMLETGDPAGGAGNLASRRIFFDVGRADLLRSNCVADAVREVLGSR